MKKILVLLFVFFVLASVSFAASDKSFEGTVLKVKKALAEKDLQTIYNNVDVNGIITSKVKKYSKKAQEKGSFFVKTIGKFSGLGEGMIVGSISKLTVSEYSKTPKATIKYYIDQLKISRMGNQGQVGFVSGTFMGLPFFISGVKAKDKWLITAIESPLIDQELKNGLRMMRIIK